jgi:hypothetical protein
MSRLGTREIGVTQAEAHRPEALLRNAGRTITGMLEDKTADEAHSAIVEQDKT